MATKITAPVKGYTGQTYIGPTVLDFKKGVATTEVELSKGVKAYLKGKGYKLADVDDDPKPPSGGSDPEPFDPGKHTVKDVLDYLSKIDDADADKHDAEVARVVEAEKAGQNRPTLLEAVEGTKSGDDS